MFAGRALKGVDCAKASALKPVTKARIVASASFLIKRWPKWIFAIAGPIGRKSQKVEHLLDLFYLLFW